MKKKTSITRKAGNGIKPVVIKSFFGGWISVKDKMPKEFKDVILTDGKQIGVGYRYLRPIEAKWEDHLGMIEHNLNPVTHWMPLPKPPKNVC